MDDTEEVARRIIDQLQPLTPGQRWRALAAAALMLGHDKLAMAIIFEYGNFRNEAQGRVD